MASPGIRWTDLICSKFFGFFNVVRGLAYQGSDDVDQVLGDPILDGSPTEYNGPKGGTFLLILESP